LAQIASYVKSLGGTTPAKAKEPQGVLYEDAPVAAAADSTKIADTGKKPDSTSKK
jgi:cytochrome c oxidase cbb3-type subunit 3